MRRERAFESRLQSRRIDSIAKTLRLDQAGAQIDLTWIMHSHNRDVSGMSVLHGHDAAVRRAVSA